MKIIIKNHSKSKEIILTDKDLKNKNESDIFSKIKDPYWSALGGNCFLHIIYEIEKESDFKYAKRLNFHNGVASYTLPVDNEIIIEDDKKYFSPVVNKNCYNEILNFIYEDFAIKRK